MVKFIQAICGKDIGGAVGFNNGTIQYVKVDATIDATGLTASEINANNIGGIVGNTQGNTTIIYGYSNVKIKGVMSTKTDITSRAVGGVIGNAGHSTSIEHCVYVNEIEKITNANHIGRFNRKYEH